MGSPHQPYVYYRQERSGRLIELINREEVGIGGKSTLKQARRRPTFSSLFSPCFSPNDVGTDSIIPLGALPAKVSFSTGVENRPFAFCTSSVCYISCGCLMTKCAGYS